MGPAVAVCSSHKFEKTQAEQRVRCSACGDWVRKGFTIFRCSNCPEVLCWSCKDSDDNEEDWMNVTISAVSEMSLVDELADESSCQPSPRSSSSTASSSRQSLS